MRKSLSLVQGVPHGPLLDNPPNQQALLPVPGDQLSPTRVRHTVKQMYGSAVAIDVADLVTMTEYERSESSTDLQKLGQSLFSFSNRNG